MPSPPQPAEVAPSTAGADAASVVAPAFESLYREHFAFVWRSVRRLGIPDGDVDDAVQDVFVVVHRRLPEFEGRSAVRTWLFGIAYRVVHGRRRRFDARERREAQADEPRPPTAPDRGLARRRTAEVLDALLAGLPPDERATFVMSEVVHMTAPEIAELTGTKLNTVYSRLRRARATFDAALGEHLAREGGELPWLT